MSEHINGWLAAYHDGELSEHRARRAEAHLESCESCRKALAQMIALRELLQEAPKAQELVSPQQFVARIGLLLPDRPNRPTWQRWLSALWRSIPIMLLLAWVFLQALMISTSLGGLVLDLGIWNSLSNGQPITSQPTAVSTWSWNLGLSGLIGFGLLSWLASWWIRQQSRNHLQVTE